MAKQENIATQKPVLNNVQLVTIFVFLSQAIFWLTSIYKDVQFEAEKTKINTENIIKAGETAKRRIKNSERVAKLVNEINHLKITSETVLLVKNMEIEILEKELSYAQKPRK
jgi:hypothetical protein